MNKQPQLCNKFEHHICIGKSLRDIVANLQDCHIVVSEIEHQSRYYVHFQNNTHGKSIKTLLSSSYDLKNASILLQRSCWHK